MSSQAIHDSRPQGHGCQKSPGHNRRLKYALEPPSLIHPLLPRLHFCISKIRRLALLRRGGCNRGSPPLLHPLPRLLFTHSCLASSSASYDLSKALYTTHHSRHDHACKLRQLTLAHPSAAVPSLSTSCCLHHHSVHLHFLLMPRQPPSKS
jgi:hypothetical protein